MNVSLGIFSMCLLIGVNAMIIPETAFESKIANGVPSQNAPHSCMVLVRRPNIPATQGVLGGCSIISLRHCVTVARLVSGYSKIELAFFLFGNRRRADSDFALIHENYNYATHDNDIAIVFFPINSFHISNVINLSTNPTDPQPGQGQISGYGFQSPDSTTPSTTPFEIRQVISTAAACNAAIIAPPSHFCGRDTTTNNPGIVCPGNNGAGLFLVQSTGNLLVGLASIITGACTSAEETGYTRVSIFNTWIANITSST